jgi:membrane protease YdiL (CAAX protease family)
MGLLAWVVSPWLADRMSGPGALPRALTVTLTGGLIWQFVLVATLVLREQRTLRWSVLKDALWLRAPRSPRTGRRGGLAWLVVLPLIVAYAAEGLLVLPGPASRDLGAFLGSHAGHTLLAGSWGWFAIIATLAVFNTVLGEELLFRGFLLPRMNGVFGRRDWLANGVLFAGYHLHMPWEIPTTLLDTLRAERRPRGARALLGAQGLSHRVQPALRETSLRAEEAHIERAAYSGGPFGAPKRAGDPSLSRSTERLRERAIALRAFSGRPSRGGKYRRQNKAALTASRPESPFSPTAGERLLHVREQQSLS